MYIEFIGRGLVGKHGIYMEGIMCSASAGVWTRKNRREIHGSKVVFSVCGWERGEERERATLIIRKMPCHAHSRARISMLVLPFFSVT